MRSILTLGMLVSTLISTGQSSPDTDTQRLLQLLQQEQVLHFRLVEMYDPYQGGHRLQTRTLTQSYFSLSADHDFVLRHESRKQSGSWQLTDQQLSFHLKDANRASQGCMDLIAFRGRRLTLRRLGRHGHVSYVYRLVGLQ